MFDALHDSTQGSGHGRYAAPQHVPPSPTTLALLEGGGGGGGGQLHTITSRSDPLLSLAEEQQRVVYGMPIVAARHGPVPQAETLRSV